MGMQFQIGGGYGQGGIQDFTDDQLRSFVDRLQKETFQPHRDPHKLEDTCKHTTGKSVSSSH